MSRHLDQLAKRLEDDPLFLACALAAFARSEELDDAGLAARLGCPAAALTHLRLCKAPRAEAPRFGQDVRQIAERHGIDANVLAEAARRGLCLLEMRGGRAAADTGSLMAARDREDEGGSPRPGGEP